MLYQIIPITNSGVNCYLVKTGEGVLLVDTGMAFSRGALKKALTGAGVKKGSINLIVITHGDYDHTGSTAYLQQYYGAKVMAHTKEAWAMERGDMVSNRQTTCPATFRIMMPLLRTLVFRRCKADIYIDEEKELKEYGIDATVIHIPGHTVGSLGVMTKQGDCFCGDLFNNAGAKPMKNSLMDNEADMDASIAKLKTLKVKKIYPGHGQPFTLEEFFSLTPK